MQRECDLDLAIEVLSGDVYLPLGVLAGDPTLSDYHRDVVLEMQARVGSGLRVLEQVSANIETGLQWIKRGGPNRHARKAYEAATAMPQEVKRPTVTAAGPTGENQAA